VTSAFDLAEPSRHLLLGGNALVTLTADQDSTVADGDGRR
jgi:hypothetical protein